MEKELEKNNDGQGEEESEVYAWLAGAFVGGFLILTIIIIIGIILWKHVKKQNMSNDQNWAGPSPLAHGNIQDEGNYMNSSILGRSMSLSHVSTAPIISNEIQTTEWVQEMQNKHFEEVNEKNFTTTSSTNTPSVSAGPTKNTNTSLVSESKMSAQNTDRDEAFPTPPLDLSEEFPQPPTPSTSPVQDLQDNHLNLFPKVNSYHQDGNITQEPLNLQRSDLDALHTTNDLELPPPPPPDF